VSIDLLVRYFARRIDPSTADGSARRGRAQTGQERTGAKRRGDWLLAGAIAIAFLLCFVAVQWPFANFLMSPAARNWVFGTHYMAYMIPPHIQARWFELNPPDATLASGLAFAAVLAFLSARGGLWWGNWMSRVQR
jgi:hypothetical protein